MDTGSVHYHYSAFGDTVEAALAAIATSAAAWLDPIEEVASETSGRRGAGAGDRDLAAADDDAGHGALGLQVDHVDDVAFGAALQRLAANGEIESDRLVDQDDGLVLLHQIGLGEIGGLQRLAGAQLLARLHADRAVAGGEVVADLGLGAALDHHVGRFDHFVALDAARQHGGFHGLDRGAGEAQFGRRPRTLLVGDFEGDVETVVAGIEPGRDRLHARRCWRLPAACPARRGRRSG